jgi:hypothetical protein
MTGLRASTDVVLLAACFVFGSALITPGAQAQNDSAYAGASPGASPGAPAGTIHFELPAEPLDQALDSYGHVARLGVLIDSNLLDGRTSAAVSGDYSPREALQRLLAGTGLQANFTGANAAVVVRSSVPQSSPQTADTVPSPSIPAADIDGVDDNAAYATLVQSHLTQALCQSPETRPGNYRMVVQLLIDAAGTVTDSRTVGSDDPVRKAAVARIARGLMLGEKPPAGLQQPITILLRPLGNGVQPDCPPADGQS